MKPQYMQVSHDPTNGEYGDCIRASLASILNLHWSKVPHFAHDGCEADELWRRFDRFLASKGLKKITIAFQPPESGLEGLLQFIDGLNPGEKFLVGGESVSGVNHYCVAGSGKILHDPAAKDGLIGPCVDDGLYWIDFIVRII